MEIIKRQEKKYIQFVGKVVRAISIKEGWSSYAVNVDENTYPHIKFTKYGNCNITGNLHELGEGLEYLITAEEVQSSVYGYSYKVKNIKRQKLNSKEDTLLFLREILTENQADVLYHAYPDIVDRIIREDLDGIDLNKTKGIKEENFRKIQASVVENYVLFDLIDKFQGMLSIGLLKKMYNKYTSVKKIEVELSKNPYKCLCELSGVGFITADRLLLDIDKKSKELIKFKKESIIKFNCDFKSSKERCLAAIMHILYENEASGNTKMSITNLKHSLDTLVPACSYHIIDCINSSNLYLDKKTKSIGIKNTYLTELYLADCIKFALKNNIIWDIDYKKYQTIGEFSLTDEQTEALNQICKYNISILNGNAGSGKSFTTEMIIKMLEDNNKSYKILAPTGRASKVIADYTKRESSTIHRGLGYNIRRGWMFNEENKLSCDIVIVDEFSMTDIFLCKHLFEAIDFSKTKLFIIGDNCQLPSVACGNVLHDFMLSNIIPTITLTKIFRYGDGGLMAVATDVRNGKSFISNNETKDINKFGNNSDYILINSDTKKTINSVLALYTDLIFEKKYNPSDILLLSPTKKGDFGTPIINNAIQKIANPKSKNEYNTHIKVGSMSYYKDDLVIQTKNNYNARLYELRDEFSFKDKEVDKCFIANGEIGVICGFENNNVIIDFQGVKVIYTKTDMEGVLLGYCITTHKSQGGSAKVVILITSIQSIFMLNSNLIYVGITRAKEKCYHFSAISTINKSIKRKENFKRNTWLQELLK